MGPIGADVCDWRSVIIDACLLARAVCGLHLFLWSECENEVWAAVGARLNETPAVHA